MWLRRLVGLVMIIICVGMNALVLIGFFAPVKKLPQAANVVAQAPLPPPPKVTVTAVPDAISAGSYSALTWTASNSPTSCTASNSWSGPRTPFGAESTGRITNQGQYMYTLSCENAGGTSTATVTLAVGPPNAPPPSSPVGNSNGSSSSTSVTTVSYCGGRVPCYNASDVAKHSTMGDCWGWLGDRVLNVSNFDTGFHAARSGVSSIQIAGVCGKDLSAAVNGQVSTPEYPNGHVHTLGATSNTDPNYLGYFVGYFDNSKP